jgi:hypothetical protein
MRGQRDVVTRKLEKTSRQTAEMRHEMKTWDLVTGQMKIEIRDRDRELIDQRVTICQIEGEHQKLKEACLKVETRLNKLLAENQATVCMVEDDRVKQAQIDIKGIHRTNRMITLTNTAIKKEVDRLSIKLGLLVEKEHVLYDLIRSGTFRYTEKLQEKEESEIEFNTYLERQTLLLRRAQRVDVLREEYLRLEKLQLQTRARLITLEQESEHRTNIHRWTLLKWTDPAQFQLLQMRDTLALKICGKLAEDLRARADLAKLRADADRIEAKIGNKVAQKMAHETELANEELRRRTIELQEMERQFQGNHWEGEKERVDGVKTQIHEVKEKMFLAQPPQVTVAKRAPRKVIMGGGFAVPNWSATCQAKQKKAAIVMPVSARLPRPRAATLTPVDRNKTRAIMSARLPDQDL